MRGTTTAWPAVGKDWRHDGTAIRLLSVPHPMKQGGLRMEHLFAERALAIGPHGAS
jgi:hypothetical protein